MKTQRFFSVVMLALLLTTLTLHATPVTESGNLIVRIEKHDAQSLAVQIANLQKKYTLISITDLDGKSWVEKAISRKNGFSGKLILSTLPSGTYIISVSHPSGTQARAFSKSEQDIALYTPSGQPGQTDAFAMLTRTGKTPGASVFTHMTSPAPHQVGVQLVNLEGIKATIELNTLSGLRLVRDVVEGESGYARAFNMDGMKDGNYYFFIRSGNRTEIQFFRLDDQAVILGGRYMQQQTGKVADMALKE